MPQGLPILPGVCRYGATVYRIVVMQTSEANLPASVTTTVAGVDQGAAGIALVDDQAAHTVEVWVNRPGVAGSATPPAARS